MITQQILEPTANEEEIELIDRKIMLATRKLRALIAERDALTSATRLRPLNTDDLCA